MYAVIVRTAAVGSENIGMYKKKSQLIKNIILQQRLKKI